MAEFTVSGMNFRSGRMDLFKQVQVLRRIGPFVPELTITYIDLQKKSEDVPMATFWAGKAVDLGRAVLWTFSGMKDEDVQYILLSCLGVVQYQQAGAAWVPIGNGAQFQEIDLSTISQIVWKVLEDNFRPFFSGLMATFITAPTTEK